MHIAGYRQHRNDKNRRMYTENEKAKCMYVNCIQQTTQKGNSVGASF